LSTGQTAAVRGRASELLRLPVRLNGLRVGQPGDLLLDRRARRAIGIDVVCGDEVVRFLPIAAARVEPGALVLDSPYLLIDHDAGSFYRRRTRTLGDLRGTDVLRGGRKLGRLDDVELGEDGTIEAILLESGERIEADANVSVLEDDAATAA
jgi:hypothetical protein